jgi:hypothetical protein
MLCIVYNHYGAPPKTYPPGQRIDGADWDLRCAFGKAKGSETNDLGSQVVFLGILNKFLLFLLRAVE